MLPMVMESSLAMASESGKLALLKAVMKLTWHNPQQQHQLKFTGDAKVTQAKVTGRRW